MDLPYSYAFENLINASRNPSSTHVADAFLTRYFQNRLLKRAMGVIKWKNLPDYWEENFLKYVLFINGYVCVVNTDRYGVIPLNCTLGGVGVMYQPTFCMIANPRIKGIIQPIIHEDCEIIKMNPDYKGVMDLVNYHAGNLELKTGLCIHGTEQGRSRIFQETLRQNHERRTCRCAGQEPAR